MSFDNPYHPYPSSSTPTSYRKAVYNPVVLLPDTPPVSPKLGALGFLTNMSQVNGRQPFTSSTPTGTSPSISDSSLPSLVEDDHDSPSTGINTPVWSGLATRLNDHIASLSQNDCSLNDDVLSLSQGIPGYPVNQHLKLSSAEREKMESPPHTPKGHPLENKTYFPFSKAKAKAAPKPFTSSLTYLLRVPRRHRPVLLFGVVIATFGFVLLSRLFHPVLHPPAVKRFIPRDQVPVVATTSTYSYSSEPLQFMNKEEELLALINFITSTTSNSLPPLNPARPLDPSIVLDFDPTRPTAREDLQLLREEVNAIYPILLLGRMRDPWHREIKKMLAEYKIVPAPLIIDVDQRRDHEIFIPLISRLLDTPELPQLLVLGKSLGSYRDVLALRDAGTLKETLESSGAVSIRNAVVKKKGQRERERLEMERLLKPRPIVG